MTLIIEENSVKAPWSNAKCIFFATLSLIIGAAIFTLAYIGMSQHSGIGSYNDTVLSWIVKNRQPQITNIFKIITTTMTPLILITFVGICAAIWAAFNREVWRPLLMIAATGVGVVSSTILKVLVGNHRPPQSSMITPYETDYSFPSNHTIGIVVFILVLSYLICSRRPGGWRIFLWTIVSIVGIGVIAASRLYLGYHWLTDVVASIGLGFIILAVAIVFDRIIMRRFED